MLKEITILLKKDISLEWRSRQSLSAILLYLFSTILVLYYSLVRVEKFLWTGVFWILIIFLSINALSGSFSKDTRDRHWYYYSLAHPLSFYFAKLVYNFISLLAYTMISLLLLNVFFGLPAIHWGLFFITLVASILGISAIFTFIALLNNKTGDQSTIMAILSTPLIFPILLAGSRLVMNALSILSETSYYKDLISILSVDLLAISLSIILFPILWRD